MSRDAAGNGGVPGLRAWLAVVVGVLTAMLQQRRFDSPTPASRLDLLHAVALQQTFAIDAHHSNTPDKALAGGHYYSDKAPGTAALALPAFAAAAGLARLAGVDPDSRTGWLVTSWAACAWSQALPAALGATALLVWLGGFVSQRAALVTVLGLTLGSLPLPYSTLLFSHAQVIGLIGIAVWAIGIFGGEEGRAKSAERGEAREKEDGQNVEVRSQKSGVRTGAGRMALAGFCLGLALASEYTAGIVVVALVTYVAVREIRLGGVLGGAPRTAGEAPALPSSRLSMLVSRPLWCFLLAAIPPLLLIPAYSWATIGTPFDLPYSYQASFPEMREGLYAIKWPDLENLGRLLLGPTRGLVFWTPFLVMAGFGWWWMAKEQPHWLWLTYTVPVLHALVISGRTWDWQAGYTLSARYMAPILPLLALPCAMGTQRWPKLGMTLAAVSIGMMTLATLTDACPDYTIYNPLTELYLPRFLKGEFSYTLGTVLFGLPPWLSVALYYAMLVAGVVWLWRLAGRADRAAASQPGEYRGTRKE